MFVFDSETVHTISGVTMAMGSVTRSVTTFKSFNLKKERISDHYDGF